MSSELERLALACLWPGFEGTVLPDWTRRHVADGLGGVVLYARNVGPPEQTAALTHDLHAAGADVLVAIDEEGGDVTRLEAKAGSSYPGNLALGRVDDPALTEAVAASMGADLRAAGIDVDFAPVADVNSNPRNPVIGVRSFGDRPDRVGAHVAAFVTGLQAAGIAACAKHFPGHGNTAVDSHQELPDVEDDQATLAAGALVPFRAAIAVGAQAIMTAHIRVRAYDSVPATLSRRVVTGLLRQELGFEGLVVTDAVEMRAISATVGVVEGTIQALAAGADAVCIGHDLAGDEVVELLQAAILQSVIDGRLTEERLAEAARRAKRLADWRAARPGSPAAAHPGIGLHAARRAVRGEGDIRLSSAPFVVELRPEPSRAAGRLAPSLGDVLAERDPGVLVHRVGPEDLDVGALLERGDGRPLVLVVRDLHRQPWAAALADAILARRPDTVVVETGVPAAKPDRATAFVTTSGSGRVNAIAAADLLLGPTTERAHRRSDDVHRLGTVELLELIHAEDATAVHEVGRALDAVARAVDGIADRLRQGGRLHYFGAGTSGRLAALDALECPQTFGIGDDVVIAHVAGFDDAEDDPALGTTDAEAAGLRPTDAVVGISASGETPYVLAALERARRQSSFTVVITCRPGSSLAACVDVAIEVSTGTEVVAGSTRLKAGVAQKMILNMLSTGIFTRLGHVYRGRMVDLKAGNQKLRGRAIQMTRDLTGAPPEDVDRALAQAGGNVKLAVLMLRTGLPAASARSRLGEAGWDLSVALGEHLE